MTEAEKKLCCSCAVLYTMYSIFCVRWNDRKENDIYLNESGYVWVWQCCAYNCNFKYAPSAFWFLLFSITIVFLSFIAQSKSKVCVTRSNVVGEAPSFLSIHRSHGGDLHNCVLRVLVCGCMQTGGSIVSVKDSTNRCNTYTHLHTHTKKGHLSRGVTHRPKTAFILVINKRANHSHSCESLFIAH